MVIARAALTLFTAWAFIHVALLTPGLAQSSSDGVVSRGYVVPGPRGQGMVTDPSFEIVAYLYPQGSAPRLQLRAVAPADHPRLQAGSIDQAVPVTILP